MPAHSRLDRWYGYIDVAVTEADGSPAIPGSAAISLLPPGAAPASDTTWQAVTVLGGRIALLFAGPDADPAGAHVIPAYGSDLWLRVVDDPETAAIRVASLRIL